MRSTHGCRTTTQTDYIAMTKQYSFYTLRRFRSETCVLSWTETDDSSYALGADAGDACLALVLVSVAVPSHFGVNNTRHVDDIQQINCGVLAMRSSSAEA